MDWLSGAGKFLGRVYYFLSSSRREIAVQNLLSAFPEKGTEEINAITKKVFENVGITFTEFLWTKNFSREKISKIVELENVAELQILVEQNQGAVFVSGHLGNWELTAIAIGVHLNTSLCAIVKTQHNIRVDKKISELRCYFGNRAVSMERAIRESISELQNGGIVALLSDQSAPKESVYVNFFGRNVATFQGPTAFALKTKKPLIAVYGLRNESGDYKISWEKIGFDDLSNYNNDNIATLTQRQTDLLEQVIRKHPEQWLWLHRRWKHVQ
ncbi:MAG: lysophospholipid acyltransferase family protein [Ignavibacteriales bacterium]|nr:lysophospholipid acyltransferase family protein [Ignavibacteriales bacterium]